MTTMIDSCYDNTPEKAFLPPAVIPKRSYSAKESVFALIFSFSGYFFIRTFIMENVGIGSSIFMLITALSAMIFSRISGARFTRGSLCYFILTLAFSLNMAITANSLILFLDFAFAVICFSLWAFSVNNSSWLGADDNFVFALGSAVFGQSFGNFKVCPAAAAELFKHRNGSRSARNFRNIFLGLLLALPVTAAVSLILALADDNFDRIMGKITNGILNLASLSELWKYLFGLPLSFLIFGIVYSSAKSKSLPDSEKCRQFSSSLKIAPLAMTIASVVPLCIVYVIFFFSQLSYFVSAFGGVLPEDFTAAEYARRGFFELCTVSVINLAVIITINLFCKSENGSRPKILSIFTIILSAFTLILIATAMSKMAMYITRFGLTPKRVYTSWFMAVLTILFVLIIIRQLRKFNLARLGAAAFTVMLCLLSFTETDALIAEYNIRAYENSIIDTIDFDGLSCDAVYAVKPCLESSDETLRRAAENFFARNTYVKSESASEKSLSEAVMSRTAFTE